jgi:hypothetical protein
MVLGPPIEPEVMLVLAKSFEIHVRGSVPAEVLEEFGGLTATVVPTETVLSGVLVDQSALYGVLNRLQGLGLDLVEVRRVIDGVSD